MRTALSLLLASPLAWAATAIPFDGPPRTIDPVWGPATCGGLPLRDLDRVVLDASLPIPDAGFGVWLADGSWLPATGLSAAGRDVLRITGPLGTLDLPLTGIHGWGALPPPSGTGDRISLVGGTLDGTVMGISPEGQLAFRTALDPEPMTLPVADIPAARLAVPRITPTLPTLLVSLAGDRPPLRLEAVAGGLVTAVGRAPLSSPGGTLTVDSPRRVWLSRLPPARVEDLGHFGVVWPWKADTDLDGHPLRLAGRHHATGLTVHSVAALEWEVGGAFLRLRGLLGISDAVAPEGDAHVTISGDGRTLYDEPRLRGGQEPRALDLDLTGVQRLVLQVGLGQRHDIGDHVVLADVGLVRAP